MTLKEKARLAAEECVDYYSKTEWSMEKRTQIIEDKIIEIAKRHAYEALKHARYEPQEAYPLREYEIAMAMKDAEKGEEL
jgi:hypothetical protein